MQSKYSKPLRTCFEAELHRRLPQFARTDEAILPAGWRLYRWDRDEGVALYLLLGISQVSDDFFLEVSWSTHGRYPASLLPMNPVPVPERNFEQDAPVDGEYKFRLSALWDGGHDTMWKAAGGRSMSDSDRDFDLELDDTGGGPVDGRAAVMPAVRDALDRFCTSGVAYCEQVLSQRRERCRIPFVSPPRGASLEQEQKRG